MDIPKQHERLMELIGHLRDGDLSESQTTELESLLDNDPAAMAYYIESIDIVTMLHRQQGTSAGDQKPDIAPAIVPASTATSGLSPAMLWSSAVLASLAIGILVGHLVLPRDARPSEQLANTNLANDSNEPEIATLSSATGCVWQSDDDLASDLPFEGQRLTARSLHLTHGVAVVHFDCDVRLLLEGPAHLDLVGIDRAMLHRGKAVFHGEGDLDRFTLATPFSEIRDEGTEYAVRVEPSGTVGEIHVFDGRVDCEPAGANATGNPNSTIRLDAGEARRFDGPNRVKTIRLDSSQFVRQPPVSKSNSNSATTIEAFEYNVESLVGLNGGLGWQGPWRQPSESSPKQRALLRLDQSLDWSRGQTSDRLNSSDSNGSLILENNMGLHRTLENPIRMDRNGAHYISFVVRKNSVEESNRRNGWAYLTLRDPREQAKKIAMNLDSTRGPLRVVHDGRATNTTIRLNDNVAYLFVCKILARKSREDQVSIRIYGDQEVVDSVEPSAWSITPRPARDDSVFSELRLYAKNCDPIQLDNIRIGKTWSSVASPYIE